MAPLIPLLLSPHTHCGQGLIQFSELTLDDQVCYNSEILSYYRRLGVENKYIYSLASAVIILFH